MSKKDYEFIKMEEIPREEREDRELNNIYFTRK